MDLLGDSDACYLPYWIDPKYGSVVRLAFPSKLSLYLAAGKPVFFHGPGTSSPVVFFEKYPVGVCCHTLEKKDILDSLCRLIFDKELYEQSTKNGRKALKEVFDMHVIENRFREFIGYPG